MGKLWSYSTGRRGASRVRVYQRSDGGILQIEWFLEGQRYQRSLKSYTGFPIHDRRMAIRLAERLSRKLEQAHNQQANEVLFGIGPVRTLDELLGRMHLDREDTWSASHKRDQARFREFWTGKLGKETPLTGVSAAMVEAVAQREAGERGWSPRTHGSYLRYLVDAFYFAERKLKWIEPRHNLSAVDIPAPNSKGRAWTTAEVRKLVAALEQVDPVAGWLGHVLWQTGRRLTAARTLPKIAVTLGDEMAVIRWPEETDKAGKEGWSVVVGRAYELTRELMARPGKYVAGPEPPSLDLCEKEWWPAAEKIAGVSATKGKKWHGIKRRFANVTEGMKSRSAQAGTRDDTLRRVYDPGDDLEAMREVARALAREVGGQ